MLPPNRSQSALLLRVSMLVAIALVILVEVTVGRSELVGHLLPRSNIGILLQTEERIIRPHPHPAIIVFGTSRGRGAFLPTIMESRLQLQRGDVLNLAMGGSNIYDAVITYERSRAELKGAAIVVIQLDPFQFNTGRPPPTLLRHYATWRERQAYRDTKYRWPLFRDYVFRSAVGLAPLSRYMQLWFLHGRRPAPDSLDMFGRLAVVRIANDHDAAEFRDSRLDYWLHWQYMGYRHSRELEDALLHLIDMAHQDGAKVYLVGMPTVPRYHEMLSAFPGDPSGVFQQRLQQVISQHADRTAFWGLPDEAGLSDAQFRDWGHLNTDGAIAWSNYFAGWLLQQEPTLSTDLRERRTAAHISTSRDIRE